jgi:DNA-binding response OmpR family regulator
MFPELNYEVVPVKDVPLGRPLRESGKQRLVLVVDDERVIANTLSVILSRAGFSVITAYDGESAFELARAAMPDLLLSDVMLGPGIDGTQLAIQIVETVPECKVLLFSGHASTADLLAEARKLGHDFTLMSKPVHPADLLARLTESFAAKGACVEA